MVRVTTSIAASNSACYIAYVPSFFVYDSMSMRNGQFSRRRLGSCLIRSGFSSPLVFHFANKKTQITLDDFGASTRKVFAAKDHESGPGCVISQCYAPCYCFLKGLSFFYRLYRGSDGRFNDEALANILMSATENIACERDSSDAEEL